MRIVLVGKGYIYKDILPKNIIDDYWIIDKAQENRIIYIKSCNEKLEMISTNYSRVINPKSIKCLNEKLVMQYVNQEDIIKNAILQEYTMYPILFNNSNDVYILYCLPDFEDTFLHVDFVGEDAITIGSNDENNIIYNNPLIADVHAKIFKNNGKWAIINNDPKYGVFVNDYPVYDKQKNIFNGDKIFIMGLEIIIVKDSLYINNPNNNVILDVSSFSKSKIKNTVLDVQDEDVEKLDNNEYEKNEWYFRSPKMIPQIKKEIVKIDEPPALTDEQQKPMLLVLGSSMAMGVLMTTSLMSVIKGMIDGTAKVFEAVLGIVSSAVMLIAMLVIPIIDVKYDKKTKEKYEEKRQNKYKQYLVKKGEAVEEIKNKQKEILFSNFPSVDECAKIILEKNHRLWERKISDEDFLSVRVGLGEVPLSVDITFPQEKFSMVEDKLVDALDKLTNKAKYIEGAPVTMSFTKNIISSIISNDSELLRKYVRNIILQLVTFHSYEDLKLVFLLNRNTSEEWEYVKLLPHIWDNSKQVRFFADNYDDISKVLDYIKDRAGERIKKANDMEHEAFTPHYLIITDDYKQIENFEFIMEINKFKSNVGISILCISDDILKTPNMCKTFLEIHNQKKGKLYQKGTSEEDKKDISLDIIYTIFFEKIAKKLANIPIKMKKDATSLPSGYAFLQMYNVGNIEQLDIFGRWKKNDSTISLKAPLGVDRNGMLVSLDAHEKYHGPHGLIAGSTGSGKSEFIITYILSLAINYHPEDVTFLLIDYKGGGLAGAFEKNNIKLPHLVGTITNINKNGLKRSLISIQSELRRRQVAFNEARNLTNEGTIDIYKYQKLYHDKVVKEPIAHLFIICDEFAELKQQQIDFMDELMSVSRIGRSLGVHLILATQKPSGIVDDQIRSNSKFGVCLKVQDVSDSRDVISSPDAAYLKNPGSFYLKVGQNEYFTLGQSGYAGVPYISSDAPIKKIDSSVEFISNIGEVIKKIDDKKQHQEKTNKKDQLTCLLEYISNLANKNNIHSQELWLKELPENIYVEKLKNKYKYQAKDNKIEAVIGEYDAPADQKQGLVKIDFLKRDNVLIYGNAESGKETFLSTLIYDLITTYTTEQVQMYILDYGTEALKIFRKSPHVGDTLLMGEDEKLATFFDMIQRNIAERKQILSEHNGDYNLYVSQGNVMPIVLIIINSYEAFDEITNDKYDDLILTLTREGAKCGILFILTVSSTSDLRIRLTSNFNKKIALQMTNEDDYMFILDSARDTKPSHIFGRGLVEVDEQVYEFQTARISDYSEYNEKIKETIIKLNETNKIKAQPVPVLPDMIEVSDMKPYLKKVSMIPIGLVKKNLCVYNYDFVKNFMTVVTSKNISLAIEFMSSISELIKDLENVKIIMLDAEDPKGKKKAYNEFTKEIKNGIKSDEEISTLCIIIGITKFASEDIFREDEFSEFLMKVKESGKHSFVIIENPDRLGEHSYDEWYTNFIEKNSGIWIGNGANSQTLIDTNYSVDDLDNNCGDSFGYVIDEGEPTLIKVIGIGEKRDDDE